jgi:hypothetical protein
VSICSAGNFLRENQSKATKVLHGSQEYWAMPRALPLPG